MKKTFCLFSLLLSLTANGADVIPTLLANTNLTKAELSTFNSIKNFFGTWLATEGWLKLGDVETFPRSSLIYIKNDNNGAIQSIEILASGVVYQVVRAPLFFNVNDNKLYGRINGVLKAIGFMAVTNNELSLYITQNGLADYANIGMSLTKAGKVHGVFNILGAPARSFFTAKDLTLQNFQSGTENKSLAPKGNACFLRMDFTCLSGYINTALGWGPTIKDALQQARYKALGTCNGREYRIDYIHYSKTCTSK